MSRSWKIGSAFGIDVYLHWTVVLLPLLVLLNASGAEGLDHVLLLAATAAIFFCVILHEFGHALAARCFGIGTRDITMYPIGGVARLERMSEKPLEEFCIAVAGPAVNIAIAIMLGILTVMVGIVNPSVLGTRLGVFLVWLLVGNVVLAVFNMLPALPMDGGRVFRALLSSFLGHLRATRIAVAVAAGFALLLGLWGVGAFRNLGPFFNGNPLLVVMAGFVFLVGQRELQVVEMRERARREEPLEVLPVHRPRPATETSFYFRPSITVYTWDSVNGTWVREGASRPVWSPFREVP
jgi:Zn-dependent protease